LFTNKPTTTPLYKALSVDFKDRMLVGEVKESERNIVAEFGIRSFPTLVVLSPEHGSIQFEGALKREALKSFMEQYALKKGEKKTERVKEKKEKKEKKGE
jgi:protein disulfide-isomerase A6